jgi:threonine dehydrogenase-like Zn-dependent dehydrogenase
MGIVEETGSDVARLKKGDYVVVPFTIAWLSRRCF